MYEQSDNRITAQQVKVLAKKLGISDTGICSAADNHALLACLADGKTPFVPPAAERISPRRLLPQARAVIMCAFNYYQRPQGKTNLSRYAWVADYHTVVKAYLTALCEEIRKAEPRFEGYVFTDNSPLCDKALARSAGLGFFGKNSLLIHPQLGSCFFIGGIVTNLNLVTDTQTDGSCGSCTLCTKACPAGLCGGGSIDGYACISYLQQKKGELTEAQQALIRKSGSAWGCDLCSVICPHNQNLTPTQIPAFSAVDPFLPPDISEAEFKEKYQNRAFFWRGYKTIKRNLDILYKKDLSDAE